MFFKMNVLRILQILAIAPAFLASNDLYTFNEDVGNRLKEYLKELSSPKPIKCEVKIPKTRNEWIPSTPWFRSRRCIKDEKWTGYQFTGKYDTLDRFHGPGKFKLGSDGITPDKNFHSTCVEFPTKFDSGAYIESIVGTFVNGTLQGNAKITFNGKTGFVISSFHEGVPHGLKRSFSHSKELIGAEIVSMNSPVGYYWKSIVDGTSYLLDFIHTNETAHQMDAYQSLVFNSSTNTFIGGTFPRYLDFLYDPYSPKGLTFKDDTQDCIKYLLWEKTYPAPEEVYSLIKHSLISALPSEKELSPESEAPAPSRLIRFRKSVLDNEALWTIKLRNTLKPVDKDAKILFLTDITRTAGNNINLYTCLLCGERVNMTHREGLLDSEGRFHGPTWISIMSENQTPDKIFNTTISNIWTQFDHGTLQDGLLKIQYKDIRNGYVHIISNTLHGPMIIHGAVPILPFKYVHRRYVSEMASTILLYENGKVHGPFWIAMLGLGTLTGQLNETGYITGEEIAYLYPDMETSYLGKFENKIMREAYLCDVDNVSFDLERSPIPRLEFKMSELEKRPFYYDPPTNDSIGAGPHILDPYDQKRVYLSDAGEYGEGVHVKVDMEVGDIACLYSYHMYYPPDTQAYKASCSMNTSKSDEYRRHCSKYALGMQFVDATLNIPPEKDLPGMFLPTLGQKLNHVFYDSHASFVDFESPRWGLISSIGLYFKPIKKGEQLYVDYGYKVKSPFPYDFQWFWDLKDKVDEERNKKELEKKKTLRKKLQKEAKRKKKKST